MPVNLNTGYQPYWKRNLENLSSNSGPLGTMRPPSPVTPLPRAPGGTPAPLPMTQGSGGSWYTPGPLGATAGDRKGQAQKINAELLRHQFPMLQKWMDQFGPQSQGLLEQLMSLSDPRMLQQLAATNRAGMQGQATSSGLNLAGKLRSMGASQSTQMGAVASEQDRATQQANQYQAGLTSLPSMMQYGQQGLNAANQHQNALLQMLQSLTSNIYEKPNPAPSSGGGGLLGTIGQIAGLGTGLGFDWGQVFRGGGGNSTLDAFRSGQIPYG